MFSNRLALALIGVTCVIAAGLGGYLAVRQSNEPATAAALAQPAPSPSPGQAPVESAGPAAAADAPDESPSPAAARPPAAVPSTRDVKAAPGRTQASKPSTTRARAVQSAPRAARAEQPAPPMAGQSSGPTVVPRTAPFPTVDSTQPEASEMPASPSVTTDAAQTPAGPIPRSIEPVEMPAAPERRVEELVVPADSVVGLQLESSVSSETARVEDRVDARVTRDVMVNGRVAIPAGARVRGSVTLVDHGGKMKERARLGVRFHTLVLPDDTTMALQTDTVFRDGDSPAQSSAAKIGGGAIGGAIIGAIFGGAKGAVIGGSTGAAGGTAAVLAGGRRPATMPAGSTITVRVLSPLVVTVED
jgi:hypothetical protein